MKKTKTTTEAPAKTVTAEPAVTPKAAAKPEPVKTGTAKPAEKKSEVPAPKSKAAQPSPVVVAEAAPKKAAPAAKAKPKASKPAEKTPELPMSERVGLTAGSIWHYLSGNGETSVAKLIKELPEEEKIIQRSLGWLAQEDKIVITVVDRSEVVVLK